MTIIPQDSSFPSIQPSERPLVTLTLVHVEGVPLIQFAFNGLQPGETPAIPVADAERLAVEILGLALSTKPDMEVIPC